MAVDSSTVPPTYTSLGIANPYIPNPVPSETGDYAAYIDNVCAVSDTESVSILVNDTAIASLVAVDRECQGFSQVFAINEDIGATFNWDLNNDGNIDQTSTDTVINYTYPQAGTYDVTVNITSSQGCPSSITEFGWVVVDPNPVADFTTDPTPAIVTILNSAIEFMDISDYNQTNQNIPFINWNFGDGTSDPASINPIHTYQDTGFYNVILSIENQYGCVDTTRQTIRVKPEFLLVVPNTFTPDGDGLNDLFRPGTMLGADVKDYSFYIFDRWGELLYEGHDLSDGWDGYFKGTKVQSGTYVWKVEVKDLEGTVHKSNGHVNILK